MPSPALAQLESLLSARKLDHTLASLSSQLPGGVGASNEQSLSPTGSAALDTLIGGLPGGQISEIVGPRSSGRQTVLVSWLAAATQRGELAALVDPLDMFDPSSAAARGVDLARVLWVRGRALAPESVSLPHEMGELRVQIERAVKALNLILQASAGGGFGLVALDLGEVPVSIINRLPFTTWRRLHRVIDGSDTACVVIASDRLARSVGGITLMLERSNAEGAEGTEVAEGFIVKNSASSASSFNARGASPPLAAASRASRSAAAAGAVNSALKGRPRHVRLLPDFDIEGCAIHARGMRTERFVLGFGIGDSGFGQTKVYRGLPAGYLLPAAD